VATYSHLMFRDEARAKLLRGANALADAVRPTLGPESHSVLLEKKFGSPQVCDDGVTIAKRVNLPDPEENLGARLLRDAATATGDAVGDGTTTAALLAAAMVSEGMRNVVAGTSAAAIQRGLNRGLEVAVDALASIARPVKDTTDTTHVATVSAHGDRAVGELVAQAVEMVGGDGVVDVQDAKSTETRLELVEGMQFDRGFLSPYFVTDPEQMRVELDDPLILLYEKKVASMAPVLPLLETVLEQGKPLLVIAENIEGEALATLVVNRIRGVLPAAAVKAPGFGERRKAMLQDIAIVTGARVISDELGDKLENVKIDDLGTAQRVVIDQDSTTIIGGAGDSKIVEGRTAEIRLQIENTTSDWDREKLEERLAKLSGGVAIIQVGAMSEVELARRRELFDDAINSTKAAMAEGIVPGGGSALLRTADAVEAAAVDATGGERVGIEVLAKALEEPSRQLARNAGVDEGVVIERVRNETGFYGFDAATKSYGDLESLGIIDAAKVVRVAMSNAVSIAATLLLTEVTLTDVDEPDANQMPQMMPEMM
jgi:chaperonin GroEL